MVYTSTAHFDQAVHLSEHWLLRSTVPPGPAELKRAVRNPVDALYSAWQLAHVPKTEDGQLDHTGRLDIEKLGRTTDQRADIVGPVPAFQLNLHVTHAFTFTCR